MPAKLYFSNSPAALLDKVADNLEWQDPFDTQHIATPTPAMKRWVQMRLADKLGIIANVEFLPLERTLWRQLEELDAEHFVATREPARLLDEQGLQLMILGWLRHRAPRQAAHYLSAGRISEAAPGGVPDGAPVEAKRLTQLSRKLAGFFREYEYSRVQEHGRQGLPYLWKHGQDCFAEYVADAPKALRKQVAELESWQKEIYHALFKAGGLRDALGEAAGRYQYTLPQYAEMVLSQPKAPLQNQNQGKPASYHLFGLSQISPFHRSLIRRLSDEDSLSGRHAHYSIYSLNPCGEYWEDALTPGEKRRRRQEDIFRRHKYQDWRQLDQTEKNALRLETEAIQAEELHLDGDDHPLLGQWGKPGRENIQLWCQITGYDFFEHFRETSGTSLVGVMQTALLHRRGRLDSDERVPQDDSLKILACPEIHREVETALHDIIGAMRADPTLRPDDIAVLVPDMGIYRHVLASVFGAAETGESGPVPFTISEASALDDSDYARAVQQIFDLAQGSFNRKDLFALLANPCFRTANELDPEAVRAWMDWSADLNIFQGFDSDDRRKRGYTDESAHTWKHGLERLALGAVMEAPREDDLRSYSGTVPFTDGRSGDRESLRAFLEIVEGLHRNLEPLRERALKPWSHWLGALSTILEKYLEPPDDDPLEAYVALELRRYILELRAMDELDALAVETPGGSSADGVTAELPRDLLLDRLRGLKAGKEPHLSGGVNMAGMAAFRSLPFRRIYVLGLGEGLFPDEDAATALDLRQYRRVIGDVDPSARNRYLFLETLVCATDAIRLSYVCRDSRQGKTFQMSPVLSELKDYLESCLLAPEPGAKSAGNPTDERREKFRITAVPLLSRDPALFRPDSREPWDPPRNPFREGKILAWLASARICKPDLKRSMISAPVEIFNLIYPVSKPKTTTLPDSQGNLPATVPEAIESEPLRLDDIRLYLENPAQFTLRRRLGVREIWRDDSAELGEEPFATGSRESRELIEFLVRKRVTGWDLTTIPDCRKEFLAKYENLTRRGATPMGHYRDLDRDVLWERAEAALMGVERLIAEMSENGRSYRSWNGAILGDGPLRAGLRLLETPELRVAAPLLESSEVKIRLEGGIPNLLRCDSDGALSTVVFMTGAFSPRRLLPALIFHAAVQLSASELGQWFRAARFTVRYIAKKGSGVETGNWAPFLPGPESAFNWLRDIVTEMSGRPDFDLLPFELIAKRLAPSGRLLDGENYAEALREEIEYAGESHDSSAYQPNEGLRILNPSVPEDAERKIRARLERFFNFLPAEHGPE